MDWETSPDVVVVGGGVMGVASAYYLAREGARVTLLERRHLASGASGSNAGMVMFQTHGPGWAYQATRVTRRLFAELARDLPVDFEYRVAGGMIVAFEPEQVPIMRGYVERQSEMGHSVKLIDGDEARSRVPVLEDRIHAAALSLEDAQVSPQRLTWALARGAMELGARVRIGVEVTGLLMEEGRVVGVDTDDGPIRAGRVVIAAGPHSPRVAAFAGISLPVKPRRVQLAVSNRLPPVVEGNVLCARRVVKSPALLRECRRRAFPGLEPEEPAGHDTHATLGHMLLVRQNANGTVIMGESMDQAVFEGWIDGSGLRTSLAHICSLMPGLREVGVPRVWNGTLGDGPDGLPLIGEWTEAPGLVIAAGHGGVGINQGPVTGLLVSQIVTGAPPAVPLEPVRPDRHSRPRIHDQTYGVSETP